MMEKKVDISKSEQVYLNLITDEEAKEIIHKGWSLSYVYSFQEFRDVYLAFNRYGQRGMTVAEFSNRYVRDKIPYARRIWDKNGRRVLEIKNALHNFKLWEKPGVFEDCEPGAPISDADRQVFKDIFFDYFRFKEYCSLFLEPNMITEEKLRLTEHEILEGSRPLFYYGSSGTRIDTFFYQLKTSEKVFKFPLNDKGQVKGGFVRFWDMFISWATQLELVERLNMKRQGYLLSNGRAFSAAYFISPNSKEDVGRVLEDKFHRQLLIDISDLVMEMCLTYRCSINKAQQAVIDYYQAHPETVSLIRTSEIFIKETELNKNDRILYPKYKGSFVSHIKLRGL